MARRNLWFRSPGHTQCLVIIRTFRDFQGFILLSSVPIIPAPFGVFCVGFLTKIYFEISFFLKIERLHQAHLRGFRGWDRGSGPL